VILLHVAPIDWQRLSGPAVSVPGLIRAQEGLAGIEAAMLNSLMPEESEADSGFPRFGYRTALAGPRGLALPPPFDRPDMVVFHSTYVPRHAAIAGRLRRMGVPYLICPRGGMTRRALAHRRWKKRMGNVLFFRRLVRRARAVHCLTQREAAEAAGWGRPVFVVGNGINVPNGVGENGVLPWPPRLVFIGRLAVRHKGLDLLLDGTAQAAATLRRCGARIDLYGPDFEGGAAQVARHIRRAGVADLVGLHGPVCGQAKRAAMEASTVFVSTSRWEGHPMAVLEAMAHGRPCLLTPGTNMAEEVAGAGAGWVVAPTATAIAEGLTKVLDSPPETIRQAGQAARRLAQERYSWPRIAALSLEAYRRYVN